ncbi:hypothetical protein PVIIG_02605 [Plasmodium vivax India VII]|uniref:TAFII55 protein conserved region domain-containing protein n=1 Tax=Plasmodium vivax India VII TaxID=1077284 RepID=A0A0J9V559_PLAVI|nr:hypothetical protein PVIIG_02605 [Plasmodium vivax India VII]
MEPKRERSSIKISLNLSANKRDDKSVSECNTGGDGDSRIKSKSKEVSQALGLIEDIRSGTFNYKDLQEIYFMNDVDLEKMIIDAKGAEEGNPEREAQDAGHSPYGGETMYGGETLYRGEDAHGESAIRSKEFTQGKLLQSGGANLHSPMHSNERSLTNENEEDNGASGRNVYVLNNQVGKVCIIRFPPEVSKEIKKNLLKKNLHLEIEPTSLLNSRLFIIHFRNINKKFWGILLELSTHIEVHKTLDRNNLYKTNDVSQMIYVYDPKSHKKQNEIVDERTDISEIINSLDNTYSIMRELEKETGGDISLETLLNYEITNENYESDVSDLLMGGSHYLRKRA